MANHPVCVDNSVFSQSMAGNWPQLFGAVQSNTIPFSAGIDLENLRKIMAEARREAEDKAYQAQAEARAADLRQADEIIASVAATVAREAKLGRGFAVIMTLDALSIAPYSSPAPLTPGQKKVFQYLSSAGLAPDFTRHLRPALEYRNGVLVETTRHAWVIVARWCQAF